MDSFIWSDTSEHRESEKANSASIQIATVSKVIRNPLILAHIKPDYGSLSEFMTDIGVAKDLLTFKKYLEA